MRSVRYSLLTLIIAFVHIVSYGQKIDRFEINTSKSLIRWAGKKIVGGETAGTIQLAGGFLGVKGKQLAEGEVVVDTKSIASEKAPARLISHLKNEDFFDVEKFPTASFVITSVKVEDRQAHVTGKMTIKGITHSLSFPAEVTYGKDVVVAKASEVKVDRTKFDIKYRSGSIFSGLGDNAIEDYFVLNIVLVAEKK